MQFLLPPRFQHFQKKFRDLPFDLLDVGCGSHSASLAKKWFPQCRYFGIDRTRAYENDANDFELMSGFYELDLTTVRFDEIPDASFDVLIMSHVIEHLPNGDAVLAALVPKLRKGGVLYLEFPSRRSLKLPSMKGTLNFYDDPTHCRIYSVDELSRLLVSHSCQIVKSGVRRDWIRVILLPLHIVYSKLKFGYVPGSVFWDLFGFADFIYAQRS